MPNFPLPIPPAPSPPPPRPQPMGRIAFDPTNWYWAVATNPGFVFSSAAAGYVPVTDPTFMAWDAIPGNNPTPIPDEPTLWDVLSAQFPAGLPAGNTVAQNAGKDLEWNTLPLGAKKLLFFMFNQIRQLNAQPTVTLAQFRAIYRALNSPQ